MTNHDTTYSQSPVMTQRHVDQLWQVCRLWPYPGLADQQTLLEIHAHLTALLAQSVPTIPIAGHGVSVTAASTTQIINVSRPDWEEIYTPPTVADCYDCDQ